MYIYDKDQFPKLSGIYRIINIVNNKCYIGSAVNLKLRLQKHYYELNKKVHNNKHLLRSYEKYGENNFKIEILEIFENINYNELLNLEKEYIKFFNSIELGYNQMLDNSSYFKNLNKTKKHIENNKKQFSKPVYAINIITGLIEYEFISVSDTSRFFNTSSSNISRICKNKLNYIKGYTFCYIEDYDNSKDYKKPLTRKGIKFSETHYNNLKNAIKGKTVYKYDLNFILIDEYKSMLEAERQNNLKKESLRYKIDKKTPFEGFYWLSTKN